MDIKIKKLDREEEWEQIFLLKRLLELVEPIKHYKAFRMFTNRLYEKSKDKGMRETAKTPYCFNCYKDNYNDYYWVRFSKYTSRVSVNFSIKEKTIPSLIEGIEEHIENLNERLKRVREPDVYRIESALWEIFRETFTYEKFEFFKKSVVKELMDFAGEIQSLNYDTIKEFND